MTKSRGIRWAGHAARIGTSRIHPGVLEGNPVGKTPLGIAGRMWEDNIKMDTE
jgi:hypothetical protein